jgi:anti-sigma factor RsiW
MNCEEILAVLVDYLNGELVIEHHETVEVHIRGCAHCETYVATYTHTVSIARTLPKCGQLPPAFEARLRALLAEHLEDGNE